MGQEQDVSTAPSDGLIIASAVDGNISYFPHHLPAVEFKRALGARNRLLSETFASMQRAANRVRELQEALSRANPEQRSNADTPHEQQRELEDELAVERAVCEDAAVMLVVVLDGLLQRMRKALGKDIRAFGDEVANGITLSRILWALANRQRHIAAWQKAATVSEKEEVQAIEALGVLDALSDEATYLSLKACAFHSYEDLEKRILSVADGLLAGSGISVEYSPSEIRMSCPCGTDESQGLQNGSL